MTEEQRHALALAEIIAEMITSGADAATLGPTDAEIVSRALNVYAASLAAL